MLSKFLIAAIVIALPSSAFCACVQSDLKGSWRFQINTGQATNNERTGIMDCVVNIDGAGAIAPKSCVLVDGQPTSTASIEVVHPRTLVVSDSCGVTLGGTAVNSQSDINFVIHYGSTIFTYFSNKASMSLAPTGKEVMLGFFSQLSTSDTPNLAVMAVKRH
jgi:hypothetical protein